MENKLHIKQLENSKPTKEVKKKSAYEYEQLDLEIKPDETGPMIMLTSLFLIWGFLTVMNGSLSGEIKKAMDFTVLQETILEYVFWAGYFIMGIVFYFISRYVGDPFAKYGYKRMIILGLIITAFGCFAFYPAAQIANIQEISNDLKFFIFLTGLISLGAGFTILQIAANSYVIALGDVNTASARLNLLQGFNSFGTYLAPIIASLLFVEANLGNNVGSIKTPYMVLGCAILFLAFLFSLSHLPNISYQKSAKKSLRGESQLWLGVLAVFLYVGGEVAIGNHLEAFMQLEFIANIDQSDSKRFSSLYWGGAMLGRFAGAIFLSQLEQRSKITSLIFLTVLCYLLAFNVLAETDGSLIFSSLYVLNIIGFSMGAGRSARTVGVFGALAIFFILVSILNTGTIAMWALIMVGMFNSIMFPTIYRLAIAKLNSKTNAGGSLLVSAIVGGAVISLIQDYIVNNKIWSLQNSFIIPMLCYFYLSYYGFRTYNKNG